MIDREILMEALGITFKRCRKKCGISQQDLAKKADLSKNAISDIELGKKCPTIETLFRIFEHMEEELPKYMEQVISEYSHIEKINEKYHKK